MTDPSACKTTIALISGGGKGCPRAPWAPGPPSSSWASLCQGQGCRGKRGMGTREAQSAMMRWDSFLHLRGPGCGGHPAEPPSPTVAISKPQSLFLPETPTALAHTSPAPRGPGWEAGDSGYGPCLTKLGVWGGGPSVRGVKSRLLGCLVPWEAVLLRS